jgi:hypothetical protein
MGKKAKEHRKKVAARNQKIKADQKKMQKMYQDMFNKRMEELSQNLSIDANGQEVPFEVVSESQTPTV